MLFLVFICFLIYKVAAPLLYALLTKDYVLIGIAAHVSMFIYLYSYLKKKNINVNELGVSRAIGWWCYLLPLFSVWLYILFYNDCILAIKKGLKFNYVLSYISISILVLSPIVEEVFFRSIIYKAINRSNGFVVSASISSLLFAFYHYPVLSINDYVFYFCFGLLSCVYLKVSKSIYPSVLAHFAVNLLYIVSLA